MRLPGDIDMEYKYSATANDGRATGQKNWLWSEDVQHQYDTLGRLSSAETVGAGGWGQSFGYDGFGNLLSKNVTKGAAPVMNVAVSAATNRITGTHFSYDAAGNMTSMPYGASAQTMTYDAANRLASVTNSGGTESYAYDTQNRRATRTRGAVTDVFFYSPAGGLLGEYRAGAIIAGSSSRIPEVREVYFYFNGQLMGKKIGPTGALSVVAADRLGSVGNYFPYGEDRTAAADGTHKFATYFRDEGSGLDYAQNRYYSATYGRFTSSDPYLASGGVGDPGSWNRYAYVQGDPVNFLDPEGLFRYRESWNFDSYSISGSRIGFYEGSRSLLKSALILAIPDESRRQASGLLC